VLGHALFALSLVLRRSLAATDRPPSEAIISLYTHACLLAILVCGPSAERPFVEPAPGFVCSSGLARSEWPAAKVSR